MKLGKLWRTCFAGIFVSCCFFFFVQEAKPYFFVSATHTIPRDKGFTANLPVALLDSGVLLDGRYLVSDPSALLLLGCGFMGLGHVIRKRLRPTDQATEPRRRNIPRPAGREAAISPQSAEVPGD